ncbi:hypothetical protein [Massilia niastensis]|uniref:hypothetical protein n=1 Tax=Massilia niastensis TaxID=544911 RepID=UPI0003759F98|nr:hypothetical protein [Massilia niastensis]
MDESKLACEEKVKEISVGNGCLYVDLLCGLRLIAPLLSAEELSKARRAPARRMMVTGHEAIVEQALAF